MSGPFRKEYRVLTEGEKEHIALVKTLAERLYDQLAPVGSQEMHNARTKLEECVMWATKALT